MSEELEFEYEDYVPPKRKTKTSPFMYLLMIGAVFVIVDSFYFNWELSKAVHPFISQAVASANINLNL